MTAEPLSPAGLVPNVALLAAIRRDPRCAGEIVGEVAWFKDGYGFVRAAGRDDVFVHAADAPPGGLGAGDRQCPRNPEKTRGFSTLEARISVSLGPIRLLLGPLIISARVLEIETQKLLASTRTQSC